MKLTDLKRRNFVTFLSIAEVRHTGRNLVINIRKANHLFE